MAHTPNTWELSNYSDAQLSGATFKDRKDLGTSQKKALWFAYMNLEVIVICIQTTEIQNVIIRLMFVESDESLPLYFGSLLATNYYQLSYDRRA